MLSIPTLIGTHVALEPLSESHRDGLQQAASDDRIWPLQLVRGDGEAFPAWFAAALKDQHTGIRFIFAVRRLATQRIVGSTGYLDIRPEHGRIEIGGTWYHPDEWGTAVNPECKWLLLSHAFDVLNLNRVAFCVDSRNTRSQAAVTKLGAQRDGVLRADRITHNGYIRDTVVFSILRAEWPAVKNRLADRLASFVGEK